MPRPAINDYVFYKISCIDEAVDLAYVGSTCNLYKRKDSHKRACNNPNHKKYNNPKYQIIRANGGWENFKLIEIGNREQITAREAQLIEEEYRLELRANMNARKCYQSKESRIEYKKQNDKQYHEAHKEEKREYDKEYRVKNIETIKEKKKEFYEVNKEQILEKNKKNYQNNKEQIKEKGRVVITCQCGCEVKKWCLSSHVKTKKHLDLMKLNNE